MNEPRKARLVEKIKERLLDGQRHVTALQRAIDGVGDEFDQSVFESLWNSSEPEELIRAYAVQAGYENVINACITAGRELCELEGWVDRDREASAPRVLTVLAENDVITRKTSNALKDVQQMRSDVQHDYVGVAARSLYGQVAAVLAYGPEFLQDLAHYVRQRT
jgi:uncharacterized protein YutE (UPF0331/DUF86 family)